MAILWIKNHGIRGESDNLRIPLAEGRASVNSHKDDGETTAIIVMRRWTGIEVNDNVPLTALEKTTENQLGSQVRFAHNEQADHPDYSNKKEELDDYYNGTHPES